MIAWKPCGSRFRGVARHDVGLMSAEGLLGTGMLSGVMSCLSVNGCLHSVAVPAPILEIVI